VQQGRASEQVGGTAALRSLVPGVYGPWTAIALGLGILLVALPLYLLEVGLSFTATSVVLAAAGFGAFAGALPSGGAIARFGERPTTAISLALAAAAIGLTTMSSDPVALTGLQLAVGAAATAMRLASLTTITRTVPALARGRANSLMGGLRRFGSFVGPLVGGLLVEHIGFTATFVIAAGVTAAGLIPLARASSRAAASEIAPEKPSVGLLRALRQHRRLLLMSASGPFLIMTARRGRAVLLPLIAAALDVTPTAVGVIVAIGMGADLMLFPVAGWIMDRFGRLRAIGPAFILMSIGLFALGVVDTTTGVVIAGALIGVGNGLSSGTMLTLASDLAPRESPSQFIAGFSAIQDGGQMVGPLLVGVIADAFGLGTSSIILGVLLLAGVGLIVGTVGETIGDRDTAKLTV
jgi:MFS family permease